LTETTLGEVCMDNKQISVLTANPRGETDSLSNMFRNIAHQRKFHKVECCIHGARRTPFKDLMNQIERLSDTNQPILSVEHSLHRKTSECIECSPHLGCTIVSNVAVEFDSALKLSLAPFLQNRVDSYCAHLKSGFSKCFINTMRNNNHLNDEDNPFCKETSKAKCSSFQGKLSETEIRCYFSKIASFEWTQFESRQLCYLHDNTKDISAECNNTLNSCEVILRQVEGIHLLDSRPSHKVRSEKYTLSDYDRDKAVLGVSRRQNRQAKQDKLKRLNLQVSSILKEISCLEEILDFESQKLRTCLNEYHHLSSQFNIEAELSTSALLCLSLCSILPFYLINDSNETAEIAHVHVDGTTVTQLIFRPDISIGLSINSCSDLGPVAISELDTCDIISLDHQINSEQYTVNDLTNSTLTSLHHSFVSLQRDSAAAQFLHALLYGGHKGEDNTRVNPSETHLFELVSPQLKIALEDSSALLLVSEILCRLDIAAMDVFELEHCSACSIHIKSNHGKISLMVYLEMGKEIPSVLVEFSYDRKKQHTLKYIFPDNVSVSAMNDPSLVLPLEALQYQANQVLKSQKVCNVGLLRKTCSALMNSIVPCEK